MPHDLRIILTATLVLSAYPAVDYAWAAMPSQGAPVPSTAELRTHLPVPAAPSGSNSIHGLVVDEVGTPLSRVRIRVLGPAMVIGVTDSQGLFRVASLPKGQYVVRAYLSGYAVARSPRLELGTSSAPAVRLTMVRETETTTISSTRSKPTELEVGIGGIETGSPGVVETSGSIEHETVDDPANVNGSAEGQEHDHGESAWRLRRLPRTPLKDATARVGLFDPIEPAGLMPDTMAMLERAVGTSMRAATSLLDLSLSGQVNLLTSGAFDRPEQLFSSNQFARNVAYVSVGSNAGDLGDWAVRGAMTQGDVSSWILAGFIVAPDTNRHAYDMGVSYSLQHYVGANPAALSAITDGARNAAEIYGFDRWKISRALGIGYGARYSRYDYLAGGGWLSPRFSVTVTPLDRFRVRLLAARRMVVPGAEEFVPTVSAGLWLPPERTFSPLLAHDEFRVERSDHYEIAVEHDLNRTVVVAFRTYRQNVDDQLATFFNVRSDPVGPSELGHYYVATAGDVQTRGWTTGLSHQIGTVRSSVEYSLTHAGWTPGATTSALAQATGSAARLGIENLSDLTTSVRAEIPRSATRFFVLYRLNSGFAPMDGLRRSARFDVQVNQSLPFLNFNDARWEMLLDVRNLFREPALDASPYDEVLVVHPPKRIVGGILIRF
jgi:TonB dependent receptor-like, beta-barrel/Carboxypeptidase regulatory-like domain